MSIQDKLVENKDKSSENSKRLNQKGEEILTSRGCMILPTCDMQ